MWSRSWQDSSHPKWFFPKANTWDLSQIAQGGGETYWKKGEFLGPFFRKNSKMCLWVHILRQQLCPNIVEYCSFSNTKSQRKTLRTSKVMKCQKYATSNPGENRVSPLPPLELPNYRFGRLLLGVWKNSNLSSFSFVRNFALSFDVVVRQTSNIYDKTLIPKYQGVTTFTPLFFGILKSSKIYLKFSRV